MLNAALLSAIVFLAAPQRIAVMDVKARVGVSADLAAGLSDALVEAIRRHNPGVAVLSSEEIRAMLTVVQQRQKLGCDEISCLSEIGGALGARLLVEATLARFGDTYLLGARLVDVEHARVLRSGEDRLSGKNDAALLDAVNRLTDLLFPSAAPAPVPAAAVSEAPPSPHHSHVLSIAFGAAAVVGVALGVVAIANIASFESFKSNAPTNHPTVAQASGEVSNANTWTGVGVGMAVVAVGGVTGAVLTW